MNASFLTLSFIVCVFSFKVEFDSEYFPSLQNLRSRKLMELRTETYDRIYHMMKTEVCFGTPSPQCLKLLYDTGSVYVVIGDKNTKFTRTYNYQNSQTFRLESSNLNIFPYRNGVIQARETADFAITSPNEKPKFLLSFLTAFNTTVKYEFDGILGLGNYYPQLSEDSSFDSFDERFSYIHYLYKNGMITKKMFAHEYKNRTHGRLYFGEVPPKFLFSHFKCNVEPFIPFLNKWHCESRSISLSSGENMTELGGNVAFGTGYVDVIGPSSDAYQVLSMYRDKSNRHCALEETQLEKYMFTKLICDYKLDVNSLPDLRFNLKGGFELTFLANDMFRLVNFNGEKKYVCKIIADSRYKYWNIGEPVLKNYDMMFDYETNTVGIRANINLTGESWLNIIILLLVLVLMTLFLIYLYANRKVLFRKKVKEDQIEKFKKGEMFNEGAQLEEVL